MQCYVYKKEDEEFIRSTIGDSAAAILNRINWWKADDSFDDEIHYIELYINNEKLLGDEAMQRLEQDAAKEYADAITVPASTVVDPNWADMNTYPQQYLPNSIEIEYWMDEEDSQGGMTIIDLCHEYGGVTLYDGKAIEQIADACKHISTLIEDERERRGLPRKQ